MQPPDAKIASVTFPRRSIFAYLVTISIMYLAAPPAHAWWGSKRKAEQKAGAILFRDKGCAHCHGAGAVGGKKAPALTTLPKDKKWTPAKISDQILNGGQKMPPFADSLTDQQVAQIVAYLRARRKPVVPPSGGPATVPAAELSLP